MRWTTRWCMPPSMSLAFAILGVEAESRAVMRRLSALRDLYDLARRRGGVGAMTLTEVFADGEVTS